MRRTPDVTRIEKPRSEARLVLDSMGQILDASDATHRLLGYRPGALLGVFLAWITPPSRHALLTQLSRSFDNARPLCLPTVLVRDDGSLLPVVFTTQPAESKRGETLAVRLEQDEEPTGARSPSRSQTFPVQRAPGADSKAKLLPKPPRPSTIHPTRISNAPPPAFAGRPTPPPAQRATPSFRSRARAAPPEPGSSKATSEFVSHSAMSEQLSACMELLHWLDMQLERHRTPELVRERALARVVVQEASSLLDQCRNGLKLNPSRAR
jgi:hypothetical protein